MNRSYTLIVLLIWIIFWLYWIISAGKAKKNVVRGRYLFWPRLVLLAGFLLILSLERNSGEFSYRNFYAHNAAVIILGFVLFIGGLALAVWARVYIGSNWGMPMSQKEEPELVTSGPYRYIRHPIYTGILAGFLATGLIVNYYWLLIFFLGAFYFIYSATKEERYLARQFTNTYLSYKKKTKMLIPFIF